MFEMGIACQCLIFALLFGFINVSALAIFPTRATLNPHGYLAIACVSHDPPQTECRFRVRYHYPDEPKAADSPIFNFKPNEGFEIRRFLENGTGQKYYDIYARGFPLRPNACVILLKDVREGRYLVGCRTRDNQGGWDEQYMPVYVDEENVVSQSGIKDPNLINEVEFGNPNATIDLELAAPDHFIGLCALHGAQKVKLRSPSSLNPENTKCTLPIQADETARGVLWATAPYTDKDKYNRIWKFMKILIPNDILKNVTLDLSLPLSVSSAGVETHEYQDRDTLTATCSVHESRYGASVSWTFGNETLGLETDGWTVSTKNNTLDWTWPWKAKTIEQTITRQLGANDNGKNLKCTAQYYDSKGEILETKDSRTKLLVENSAITPVQTLTTLKELEFPAVTILKN